METDLDFFWKALQDLQQTKVNGAQFSTLWADLPSRAQSITASDEFSEVVGGVISQRKIYPHAFDDAAPMGAARLEYQKALELVEACSDCLLEGDFVGVSARLSDAALVFKSAHANLDRNDPLAALTGYLRRAMLAADPAAISRTSIEALRSVVASILNNPVVTLVEAAERSDQLERAGWDGDEPNVAALFATVMADAGSEVVEPEREAQLSD